ncbi:hypothetical protein [Sedimentibacter sp. B4]|uniref:hypothetical protein n=1 Tax=Sedimentibacter sp. B4 TaxID=304766 RepID=UPI0002F83C95|nr:hypothetical protein [Sedimentibacter sp. B4]
MNNKNYSKFYQWIENTIIDPQIELPVFDFLYRNGLSKHKDSYKNLDDDFINDFYGVPVNRASKLSRDQIDYIKKNSDKRQMSGVQIWDDYINIKNIAHKLDYDRMPENCIAFYRPFHLEPFEEWGIYIYIDQLITYCENVSKSLGMYINIFQDLRDTMSFVLFEIFHHEFFHHIVESAVTTIEIVYASSAEKVRPYYLDYRAKRYCCNNSITGEHPNDPLEEALANTYAYNSLSFNSRVQFGYKTIATKVYQKALKNVWKKEPAGYCFAEKYIDAGYKTGSSLLLTQILSDINYMTPETIGIIAQNVLFKGHSAFVEKANVPVYLVGNNNVLSKFYSLIPAPNETYTTLFMAHNDSEADNILVELKKEHKNKANK